MNKAQNSMMTDTLDDSGRRVARLSAYEDAASDTAGEDLLKEKVQACDVWPKKAIYEALLELTENSDERYEYIDGEIYLLALPKTIHQMILGELYGIFYN
ncbi:MAG: hypothetical protein WC074_01380 [bacterium]